MKVFLTIQTRHHENFICWNIKWFNGSGARAGYYNIGKTTNVVAGTGQALKLNSNGTATDINTGKQFDYNRTILVNSSTGTTFKSYKNFCQNRAYNK